MQEHPGTTAPAAVRGLWTREEGQAAVEYGVLAALIIGVCVAIITTLGTDVSGLFNSAVAAF
jgi:Flp pilus assembly pilin Flp